MQHAWAEEQCIKNFRRKTWKRQLGEPKHKWEDNIKMFLRETEGDVEWIYVDQDRDQCRTLVYIVTDHKILRSCAEVEWI
jgi:hypothetical protein